MGGGILPITINRGNILVLMGQERSSKLWCDFGGRPNPGESFEDTALREGEEETNGFLGRGKYLKDLVNNNLVASIENGDRYVSYVFKIKYDNKLPHYFNNNNSFLEQKLKKVMAESFKTHNGLFEKSRMKWFTIDEIQRDLKQFRQHYIPILKTIITKEDEFIEKLIEQNTRANSTRRRGKHLKYVDPSE